MKNLLLFLFLFSTVAWAQPRAMGDASPMRGMRMMDRMKLTDEQRQQVGKLHSDLEKKQIAIRAKIQALRVDMRDAFRDEKPDKGKIESKMNEVTKLQGEMKSNYLAFWFDVNKMLIPEQQKIWKEAPMMMNGMKGAGMRGGMRGRMHCRGKGMGMMGGDDSPEPEDDCE